MSINITKQGKGIPLVFFHGWGFDSQIWNHLIPHLDQSLEIYLVDLPGFGYTPLQDWFHFKASLLELLPTRFVVVGWSLGGLYATRLASESPERVSHLFNITSSPCFIEKDEWPGISKDIFIRFYHHLNEDIHKTVQDFIALQAKNIRYKFNHHILPSKEALESGLLILKQWDLRPLLNKLMMPACFLFGRLDPITPVKTMRYMQEHYPAFHYVLFDKAAHMPFMSHPELFVTALEGFIQ